MQGKGLPFYLVTYYCHVKPQITANPGYLLRDLCVIP